MATHHPALMPRAVGVVELVLRGLGSGRTDLAKLYLNFAVELLVAGCLDEVLALIMRWGRGSDPSLLRHFVFQLLSACAPPYSQEFASRVISLMLLAGMKRNSASRGSANAVLLEEFAKECRRMDFQPALPTDSARLVQDLLK